MNSPQLPQHFSPQKPKRLLTPFSQTCSLMAFLRRFLKGLTTALPIPLPTASPPSSSTSNSASLPLCSFPLLLFPRSFQSGFSLSLRLFLARSVRDSPVLIHPFPFFPFLPLSHYHTTHLSPQFHPHSDYRFTPGFLLCYIYSQRRGRPMRYSGQYDRFEHFLVPWWKLVGVVDCAACGSMRWIS
jgi:hypothetical protein